MQKTDFFYYNQRVELNRETIMMLNFVGPYINFALPEFSSLVIASLNEEARAEEAANEWKGLVQNMKEFMSKMIRNQRVEMEKRFNKVDQAIEKFNKMDIKID